MTAFCLSSTSRSRPTAFMFVVAGGDERLPAQPVPPDYSVDTPFDEPIDRPAEDHGGPPPSRPSKKHVPDEEHGVP